MLVGVNIMLVCTPLFEVDLGMNGQEAHAPVLCAR